MQIEQRAVTVNDIEFAYLACGDDGPLALCLHGFPDTAWTWRHPCASVTVTTPPMPPNVTYRPPAFTVVFSTPTWLTTRPSSSVMKCRSFGRQR